MASLRMANQIGLDAGLMHVWCSVWVNALALPAMIALQRSIDIGFTRFEVHVDV